MTRHTLLAAVVAAAALTLGACGSTAGTATGDSSAVSSVESAAADSSTADAAAGATEESTAEDASVDTTAESAASSTTVTVDGTIDAQSAAWFGAVCDGVSPMLEAVFGAMGTMMSGATGSGDAAATAKQLQATLVETFNKASDSMTEAADKLSSLPPPSIDHGEEIAAEAAAGMAKAGPAMKQIADALSKATVTSMDDLSAAMQQANDAMDTDLNGLSLNNFELSDQMQAEVAKIPACAPLMSLGDLGGAAPTT